MYLPDIIKYSITSANFMSSAATLNGELQTLFSTTAQQIDDLIRHTSNIYANVISPIQNPIKTDLMSSKLFVSCKASSV